MSAKEDARAIVREAGLDDACAERVASNAQGREVLEIARALAGDNDPDAIRQAIREDRRLREAVRDLLERFDREEAFGAGPRRGRRRAFWATLAYVVLAALAVSFAPRFAPGLEDTLPEILYNEAVRDVGIVAIGGLAFILHDVFSWLFGGYRRPRRMPVPRARPQPEDA